MKQSTFSAQVANNLLTVLQGYSKTIRLLLVMFLTLTVTTNAWAETHTIGWGSATGTAGTYTNFTATSGTVTNVVSFSTAQNSASNAPAYNSSSKELRLYYNSGGNGCSITLTPATDVTITAVTITASSTSYTPTVKYNVNGGTDITGTWSSATMTISGINATTSLKIRNANTANKQLRIKTIQITYTAAASCNSITPSLSYTPSSLSVGGTANPTLTGNTGNGTVTYTSSSTSVATVNASTGVVTAKAAGTTTITATIAANNGYCEGTATANVTVTADPYTVTLVPGSGSVTNTELEGANVDLPTPTLDCGDWEFAGWKTTSAVTTETTTEPTLIAAGAYSPTSDITLYAVYQRTETTSGGGSVTPQTDEVTISDFGTGTSTRTYSATYADWTWAKNSGSNIATYDEIRLYASHSMKISPKSGYTISSIVATCTSSSYASALAGSSLSGAGKSVSGSTVTITPTSGDIVITQAAQSRVSEFTVTYSTTAGGTITTTYYHSTPDCGSTASTYTLTLHSGLSCVTDGSATVELNATELTNFTAATRDGFTCSGYWSAPSGGVKVLNADGTFAATSVQEYITDGKWTNEGNVTLTPRWECSNTMTLSVGTQSGGTYSLSKTSLETCDCTDANRQVTITATPNSGYSVTDISYSGNGTATKVSGPTVNGNNTEWVYQFDQGDNGNGTFTVTFTTIPTYIITLDAGSGTCDDESLTETSGGAGVTLPTANPPAACATDGWEFAGWWTESVTETTTSSGELLTAGSNYKPASDCTLYAVYSYTEAGGGGSTDYVLTNIGDIDDDDIVVITMTTSGGTTYAMSNNNGTSAPTATSVTVSGSTLTGDIADNLKWNITNNAGSLTIYPNGTTSTWLYCTNTNNGVKVGNTEDGKAFTIDATSGYLKNTYTSRYVGVYTTNPDWRCYTSTTTNIADQTLGFYVKSSGGSTTTYNSNPVCVASWSITYDFAGGTGSHCSNTSVPQGNPYTICDEAPTKEGNTFQGWSDGTSTYDGGATFTPTGDVTLTAVWKANTYTVTWNNNGDTDEVTYNHGVALVVPTAPASCDGVKEFVGWTTHSGYYHATTAPDDIFTTKTTPVTATATYYAVFATPPGTGGGGGGSETTIDDVLTRETTGITDGTTTYSAWSGKKVTSSAIYEGNSAGGNNAIQLRSNNSNSGIITTTSGGKITHVEVDWESNTASGRTLDIYGRNVAYADATDLYDADTRGTKLGSIVYGTSTELEITGDYEYIGLRSNSGAMYLTSVTITWSSAGGSSSYTDYTTICQEVTGIAISGSYPTTFVQYDSFSFAGGIVTATFENGTTQDVTSLATFSGYNMDEVGVQTVTVTYMGQTAKYEITITQSDRWRLTWNVSGKTNTGARPIYVQKGSAIGTLPIPEVPAACAGKTFMGWTESNIVPSDGKGIVYITEETVPSKNTTYYAVFATVNNFSVQKPINDITDGSKVVIVAVASMDASGGAGQAISSRTISITSKGVIGLSGDEVSIFDETINTPHSTCIWTLTKEGGGIVFEQGGKYIRAVDDGYRRLLLETTKDYWTLSPVTGKDKTYHMQSGNTSHYVEWFDHTDSKYAEGERYIGFVPYTEANDNGDFDMQFYVTANADGNADITDYTTGCAEYTITYYGFHGGYSTSCSSDGTIVLPVNSLHTVPDCGDVVKDHTNLGRTFTGVWMTKPHGGQTFKPGDTFILTQDTTLYAQWELNTQNDFTTLPTDVEDLAGTDVYVYGGKTLTLQPGTTTINSLTLKGGLQADGSYKMPTVWVPEGATLVRNSNKINLDLKVNAKNYYPFAVPFATKNNENVEYLDPVLAAASTYGTHFAIKTYDGARRADVGEDKANNWVRVLRGETLQPGVGYIITALTYPAEDTATIRIPMTVSNTWFKNGEQAEVGTTVRNTIAVTAHAGEAATEHQRHAGWNFVANPYLTSFAGGNVANDGGLAYINGELIIQGSYEYGGDPVPYVTVPAYDFAYYSQHKLSDVKLSPEWSFFVQVGTGGTMNFTTAGRQQAPASIAARNAEERPVKMDVDLILSDNHSSDQTGLIICDRYSDAYEIGRDLEKLFGSAYNLSVYTLMEDNTPLAFQALAIRSSMQVIPVGYRAPEQGEYTFRLNEATSSIDLLNEQYEQLVLVDYQTGELTNLLYTDYTFYSERTQSNSRFAIYAVPRQNAPTDLPNAIGSDEEVRKVIYNDHLYILRDGNVYNGMGQKM